MPSLASLTKSPGLAALVLAWSAAGWAAEHTFQNEHLRVTVNAETAAIEVFDKRIGHRWRQPEPARVPALSIPRAPSPIQIDGDLTDWQWLTAATVKTARTTVGAQAPPAEFHVAWDEARVYFAVKVHDAAFVEPPKAARFWDGDSVELWLDGDQFGAGTVGGKPFVVCHNRATAATDAQAAVTRHSQGWTCEVALPTRQRPRPPAAYVAVGVNDADEAGRRCRQQYYPRTWVQWRVGTYARASFVERAPGRLDGTVAGGVRRCSSAKPIPGRAGVALTLSKLFGSPVTATVTLEPHLAEVVVTLSGPREAPLVPAVFPDPIAVTAPEAAWIVPQQEGMRYPVRGDAHPPRSVTSMMSMPWIGATQSDAGAGYMIIAETPDDVQFAKRTVLASGERVMAAAPHWRPQKGKLGYPRRLRYVFFDQGGYVAMCKRYRAHAKAQGIVRTLAEKAEDVPNIRKLAGAVDIWYTRGNAVALGRALKSLGIDRALIHISSVGHRPAKATVAALGDMGYLVGHYDIYTDLHESGHRWDTSARYRQYHFPDPVIRKADGSLQKGWYTVYDKGKPYRSFVVNPRFGLDAMRERVPADHRATGHTVWFIDCTTSCGLYECYGPRYPLTRSGDREAKLAQFKFLHDRGLVCGSEGGRDWALRYASYFEGIMSTACWQATPKNMGRVAGPLDPDDRYMAYDHGPGRRLPLWELVHHDAACVTWWWGDGQLRAPENWWIKDLFQILYGTMPLWMMRDAGEQLFTSNADAFRESYARFSPVARAVFGVAMLTHETLTKDRLVQRTRWANGLSITANFGPEAAGMAGYSYRLDGDQAKFPGLPIGKPVVMPHDWKPPQLGAAAAMGFDAGVLGWWAGDGMALSVEANAREGEPAGRFQGTNEAQWNIGGYSGAFDLTPGKRYRYGAWVKISRLEPVDRPPTLAIQITGDKGWITNIHTAYYDVKRLGEWQRFEKTFVCPAGADCGRFAIEKTGRAKVSIDLLLAEPFLQKH